MGREYLKKQAEIAQREKRVSYTVIVLLILSLIMFGLAAALLFDPEWMYRVMQPLSKF